MRILEDIRDAEESFSSRQANPRGRLRVDVATAVASRLLIPALHTFFERYPDIQLELGASDRPLNLLGDGVDCALRGGEIEDQSMIARRVGTHAHGHLRHHRLPHAPGLCGTTSIVNASAEGDGADCQQQHGEDTRNRLTHGGILQVRERLRGCRQWKQDAHRPHRWPGVAVHVSRIERAAGRSVAGNGDRLDIDPIDITVAVHVTRPRHREAHDVLIVIGGLLRELRVGGTMSKAGFAKVPSAGLTRM